MVKLYDGGVYLVNGVDIVPEAEAEKIRVLTGRPADQAEARNSTMAWRVISAHNRSGDPERLNLYFDSMTSHDITYVGIIQTARASGMTAFPLPYVLTNCHNSLCAVGGTINEDDHKFALSAAHRYGGIYVPPNLANIHSYNRETMAGCGRMILGSDSHTRYGALGCMGVGEGGGELAKQLLGRSYDLPRPGVVAVYLTGALKPGVGPQDAALSIIGKVYDNGYVKKSWRSRSRRFRTGSARRGSASCAPKRTRSLPTAGASWTRPGRRWRRGRWRGMTAACGSTCRASNAPLRCRCTRRRSTAFMSCRKMHRTSCIRQSWMQTGSSRASEWTC